MVCGGGGGGGGGGGLVLAFRIFVQKNSEYYELSFSKLIDMYLYCTCIGTLLLQASMLYIPYKPLGSGGF